MEIARVFVFVCLQVCVCDDNLKINVGTIFRYMYAEYNFEMVSFIEKSRVKRVEGESLLQQEK